MKFKTFILATILLFSYSFNNSLWAEPTTAHEAEKVVRGWLKTDNRPLNAQIGQQIRNVEIFTGVNGEPVYYIVYMQPNGFVIVSADDLLEPIIGFVEQGIFDPSLDNPLGALVTRDLNGRMDAARRHSQTGIALPAEKAEKAQNRWNSLIRLGMDGGYNVQTGSGIGSISEVRVAPLLQSLWGQRAACSLWCYNYYVALNIIGSGYAGCVATAMAQLMRYHQYPTDGIGIKNYTIYINGVADDANTLGGDENGGAYNWSQMPLNPEANCPVLPEAQRKAIGSLCYDAGLSVNMNYRNTSPPGSTADTLKASDALKDLFGYGNAVKGYNGGNNIGSGLTNMINPNLDAKDPVLLGITGSSGGHAIVCDGYGFDGETPYHHLNMGWDGDDNAWYNLPDIDTDKDDYTSVYKCVYNVHITAAGDGEIISGRIFDACGIPIPNPIVYADPNEEPPVLIACSDSDSNGIYAFDNLESNKTYIVSPLVIGYIFTSQEVTTGASVDNANVSGNVWGIDFYGEVFAITNITPASGPPGAYIKIEGDNFGDTPGHVIFNGGDWGEELQWSNTLIYCTVPSDALSGDVKIATAESQLSAPKYFEVTEPNELIVDNNNCTPGMENGTEDYPFSTIQRGINAGKSGMKVIVKPNIYYENIDFKGIDIILTSVDANDTNIVESTVIDGNENGSVVLFDSGESLNCVIRGLTIRNGSAAYGGGIYCGNSAPTIEKCLITYNDADHGGGISSFDFSPTVQDCRIIYNSADEGGGLYFYTCQPTVKRCLIAGNAVTSLGGGIYLEGYLYTHFPVIENSLIIGNSAQYGGGVFNKNSNPYIEHCDIISNKATVGGGGITVCNGVLIVDHDIFWTNTAPSGASVVIFNCGGFAEVTIAYCDMQGGLAGIIDLTGSSLHWHATNINSDPLFVEEPYPGPDGSFDDVNDSFGDLHIDYISPCIDAGDPCFADSSALDFDSRTRVVDGDCNDVNTIDIGAYEFNYVYLGDFAGDCDVDFGDFAVLAESYQQDNPTIDIAPFLNPDGIIDFKELLILCDNWLEGCD
ncbi:MAG: C10 family peptidase [Sedimentisphaerales bacterium]|nr:C10 family peptidase [Sedimentisphaerales bacterium]